MPYRPSTYASAPLAAAFGQGAQLALQYQEQQRLAAAQAAAMQHQQVMEQLAIQQRDLEYKQALFQAGMQGPTELKALGLLLGIDTKAPYFQSLSELAKSKSADKATVFGSILGLQPGSPQLEAFQKNPELAFQALTTDMEIKAKQADIANKQAETQLKQQKMGMISKLLEGGGGGTSAGGPIGQDTLTVEQAAGAKMLGIQGADMLATTGTEVRKEVAKYEAEQMRPISPQQKRILGVETPGKVTQKDLEGQFIVPDKETTKALGEQITAVQEMDSLGKRAIEILDKQGGKVLGPSGQLNTIANSLRAQAEAMLDSLGGSVDVNRNVHRREVESLASKYLSGSASTAADRSKLGSVILDLAIASMAAKGQSGRQLSDKDLSAQIKALGENPDPAVFKATIQDMLERSWNRVALDHAQATSPGPVTPEIQRRSMAIVSGEPASAIPPAPAPQNIPSTGYPDGTVIVNPSTGEEMIAQGGVWVRKQ